MKPYFEDEHVKIYHGDSRELLPMMPKVDLVLTDPPYGIGYHPDKQRQITIRGGRKIIRDRQNVGDLAWDKAPFDPSPVLALQTASIIWGANNFASRLPDSGGWLVWCKLREQVTKFMRSSEAEFAWTNVSKRSRVFQHLWMGNLRDSETNCLNYHPTQKPVALMRWCLGLVKDVQTVIDPYMGSGTTLRAAKDMGIKAIGIEIDERYCAIAAERMRQGVLTLA